MSEKAMIEMAFLGTAAAVPTARRGSPALLVIHNGGRRFLVDCGEGTQRQLLRGGLGLRVHDILLTHEEWERLLGLPGLLLTMARQRPGQEIRLHGPRRAIARARRLLTLVLQKIPPWRQPRLQLSALPPAADLLQEPSAAVTAFPVFRRPRRGPVEEGQADGRGYRFIIPPRHRLSPERLAALGVPEGPERRRLARGEAVTLPDGRVVRPEEVQEAVTPGVTAVVVGDVGQPEALWKFLPGVDVLVVEAVRLEGEGMDRLGSPRLTVAEAARLATWAKIRHLIFTHIREDLEERQILEQAQRHFQGESLRIARDLDRFRIHPGGRLEHVRPGGRERTAA